MGRPIHAIFVTADGLECPGVVQADDLGRPPRVWETYVPERVRLARVAEDEVPTASKFIRRRYEVDYSAGAARAVYRYREVSPHDYEKELAGLRLMVAKLEVDNGLLRARLRELTTAPSTGASA